MLRLNTSQKMQIARIASRVVKLTNYRPRDSTASHRVVRRSGITWALDLNEGIDLSIYLLGAFERSMIREYSKILQSDSVVIDVGANIGSHTLQFAKLVPNGRVFACEPTNYAFTKLQQNLALNPTLSHRVRAIQAFLTGEHGTPSPKFLYSSWPLAGRQIRDTVHHGVLKEAVGAESLTLDELVDRLGLERLDLVKIDVDGNEFAVISGGINMLRRYRPNVILEWCPSVLARNGDSANQLQKLFLDLGYFPTVITSTKAKPRTWQELPRGAHQDISINLLLKTSVSNSRTGDL